MQQYEKRIREALEAGEFEDLLFAGRASGDLHALLAELDNERRENNLRKDLVASGNQLVKKLEADLDEVRGALQQALDEAIFPSKHISDVYERATAAITKASADSRHN